MGLFSIFKKQKQENMFEVFPDGILVVSMDGKILDANEKALRILGYTKLEIVGSYFSQYVQGGSVLLNKLVQSDYSSTTKAVTTKKDDVYVEVSASKNDEFEKVYVSIRDITKIYKMHNMINGEYEIAKKIIDEKNIYLKEISEDVFSLLSSVTNFSKALQDGVGGPLTDKQGRYVNIINKNSFELSYNLDKLFKYFEVESGLYPYEYKRFDLADLILNIARTYEAQFSKKKLSFTYDMSSFLTRSCNSDITAVENLIKTILDISLRSTDIGTVSMNVGNPPVEFLESKGIEITDENMYKRFAMFEIKDSGMILPPVLLDNIFNPYFLDSNILKKSLATKLAFSLCYKHIKNLKGNMWVYSKPAQGTLTCILLPMEKN